jgi:hypothetical protein
VSVLRRLSIAVRLVLNFRSIRLDRYQKTGHSKNDYWGFHLALLPDGYALLDVEWIFCMPEPRNRSADARRFSCLPGAAKAALPDGMSAQDNGHVGMVGALSVVRPGPSSMARPSPSPRSSHQPVTAGAARTKAVPRDPTSVSLPLVETPIPLVPVVPMFAAVCLEILV